MNSGAAIGGGRSLIKNKLGTFLSGEKRLLENLLSLPELQDSFFHLGDGEIVFRLLKFHIRPLQKPCLRQGKKARIFKPVNLRELSGEVKGKLRVGGGDQNLKRQTESLSIAADSIQLPP
jgi:hypothetical protein